MPKLPRSLLAVLGLSARRQGPTVRVTHWQGEEESDDFSPQRRVAGASTGRKAMDTTRGRLVFMMLVFGLVFSAIGLRVIEIGTRGSFGRWQEAQAALPEGEKIPDEAAMAEEQPPKVEGPGIMDALLGHDEAVPASEAEASLAATVAAAQPKRGDIVDRNGALLATSVQTQSLYADAKEVRPFGVEKVAARIHAAFPELSEAMLVHRLSKGGRFIYLKRHLTPAEQDKVLSLGTPGLSLQADARRVYPQGGLLAHVLGYVDIDNHGLAGIEKRLDDRLTDPTRNYKPLTLSVDLRVQNILRQEMSAAVADFQAVGAAGVVMDIENGEILAMSSLPDFDLNYANKASDDTKFNRASLGVYEMGSTFKTFSIAGALHYRTTTLLNSYDATQAIRIGRFSIRDAHPENRWLTVPEVYAYSSNIGTVQLIKEVGPQRQREFLKSLGLMEPIDVELPERGRPQYPKDWTPISMMTISYGHGMSVTPLHLVRAFAAIAGGGVLKPITLLKGGAAKSRTEPVRVVEEKVSRQMRDLMRLVVQFGTASKADAPGYEVGGKTGTAEKVSAHGGYARNDKMASFIGIFPSHAPRYVVLVMIDTPRGNKSTYGFATGGWVSAPVVGKVVARIGPLLGMKPNMEANVLTPGEPWLEQARAKLIAAKGH